MGTPILRNMDTHWKKALASTAEADSVLVFSPFLTGPVDKLLITAKATKKSVYTRFDVETFVSGASTISALRRLIAAKVEIWKVDGLHAKMVIVEGKFLSIGSQNLTVGGTKNKEATVVCDATQTGKVLDAAKAWCDGAARISEDMITHMKERVKKLAVRFRSLQKLAKDEDARLRKEQKDREKERLRKQQEEEVRKANEQIEREMEDRKKQEREWNEKKVRWRSARREQPYARAVMHG